MKLKHTIFFILLNIPTALVGSTTLAYINIILAIIHLLITFLIFKYLFSIEAYKKAIMMKTPDSTFQSKAFGFTTMINEGVGFVLIIFTFIGIFSTILKVLK